MGQDAGKVTTAEVDFDAQRLRFVNRQIVKSEIVHYKGTIARDPVVYECDLIGLRASVLCIRAFISLRHGDPTFVFIVNGLDEMLTRRVIALVSMGYLQ